MRTVNDAHYETGFIEIEPGRKRGLWLQTYLSGSRLRFNLQSTRSLASVCESSRSILAFAREMKAAAEKVVGCKRGLGPHRFFFVPNDFECSKPRSSLEHRNPGLDAFERTHNIRSRHA